MDQFIVAIIADVSAHMWMASLVALAMLLGIGLNPKSSLLPVSIPQGWRVVASTACTIVGVVGDQLLRAPSLTAGLIMMVPWFIPAVGVLSAEIAYARAGKDVPPDQQNLPPAPGAPTLSSVACKGTIAEAERPNLVVEAVRSFQLASALIAVLGLSLVGGCAGSFNEAALAGQRLRLNVGAEPIPAPSARCVSLDNARRNWGAIAKGAAVAAGAEGLASLPIEDKTSRLVVLGGGIVVGVVAGIAVWVSEDFGATWARECSSVAP